MRTTGTSAFAPKNKHGQHTPAACEAPFASSGVRMRKRERLFSTERDTLRHLIQGPVAARMAGQLSTDLGTGLEKHPRCTKAIANLRSLVLDTGSSLENLLSSLEQTLPPKSPPLVKILILEAAARQLGREWSDDITSFVDVAIAAARLQGLAQALAQEAAAPGTAPHAPFAAILLPEGEQHTLMPYLTGALFNAFGWQHQVLSHRKAPAQSFATAMRRANAVCIGWSTPRLKPQVRHLLDEIKLNRPERKQPVIAGGFAALDSVDFLVEMGIDCVCDTAYSAVKIAVIFTKLEKMSFKAPSSGCISNCVSKRIDWRIP